MKLELKNINKSFHDKVVLHQINFSDDITSIAVIGPSGGGKSTLLRILGGLIQPDSGTMLFDNSEITYDEQSLHKHRKRIGFVFQTQGLFEHFTALENVILPLIHTHHLPKSEAIERAKGLFSRFGLSEHIHKYPFQLSGGQQQRISIARSIAIKPLLLLLDEPTSALDPEYTAEVLDMLGELQLEGLRTIIVTHEMGFAKHACDKVLFLADNTIIAYGKSKELFSNPQHTTMRTFLNTVLEWRI